RTTRERARQTAAVEPAFRGVEELERREQPRELALGQEEARARLRIALEVPHGRDLAREHAAGREERGQLREEIALQVGAAAERRERAARRGVALEVERAGLEREPLARRGLAREPQPFGRQVDGQGREPARRPEAREPSRARRHVERAAGAR